MPLCPRPRHALFLLTGMLLAVAGCRRGAEHAPAIAQAYVGPATLNIRADIPLQSRTVATVKHGDRLDILHHRRRFLQVRTPSGVEGWTDERQLLSADDMAALAQLAERARKMPAQGQANSDSPLNLHTMPSVQSPSFLQIKVKEKVDVLEQAVLPRTEPPRKPLIPPPPPKKARAPAKPATPPKYPPPPMPKPPGPPPDWLELSKTDLDEDADETPEETPPPKPVSTDSWSLVRTASGQAGWVLTRRLVMAIPDEVAQYAEGHRIVSYFPLGEIQDEDQKKPIWLWTTIAGKGKPYDFDSFRVFTWSLRRHRYETAYIERNVEGYAPVLLQQVEMAAGGNSRNAAAPARYAGFSLCLEKSDGHRYRREYALLGNIVRFAGEQPCEVREAVGLPQAPAAAPVNVPAAAPQEQKSGSFGERLKKQWHALKHSLFGG